MLISHSEVDAWLTCKRKWYYAYIMRIKRKAQSPALARGILGHELLEGFFTSYKEHKDYNKGMAVLIGKATEMSPNMDEVTPQQINDYWMAVRLTQDFVTWLQDEGYLDKWTFIEVEKEFRLPITADDTYCFKVDAIIYTEGRYYLIDWKFIYNFYRDDVMSISPQMRRYIKALRELGFNISDAWFGMIRYRKDAVVKYGIRPLGITTIEVKNVWADFLHNMIDTIADKVFWMNTPVAKDDNEYPPRSANVMMCDKCPFLFLCLSQQGGSDGLNIISQDYVHNSYGYTEQEDEPSE